ncbi:hypothetical protein GPALN_005820 [Globodera pallida]|nr:hypothetical protein GPALN_005820 [Globodera pallida]
MFQMRFLAFLLLICLSVMVGWNNAAIVHAERRAEAVQPIRVRRDHDDCPNSQNYQCYGPTNSDGTCSQWKCL